MILRILLICSIFTYSFSAYEKVKIGKIDEHYKNKLSFSQLKTILLEIENTLETQLNENIIDYALDGKEINIVYEKPSSIENKISRTENKISLLKNRISKNQNILKYLKEKIDSQEKIKNRLLNSINNEVRELNRFIEEKNRNNNRSKEEYLSLKRYVKIQKDKIKNRKKDLNKKQNRLKSVVSKHNNKVHIQNTHIQRYNNLVNKLEKLSRGYKKVKGATFTTKQVITKNTYKNGIKSQEKLIKNENNRIDIYGFNSLKELKVILAHEIGHLIGLPHINVKGALMNPILQKEQEANLKLTKEDINNFYNNFYKK